MTSKQSVGAGGEVAGGEWSVKELFVVGRRPDRTDVDLWSRS